MVEYDDRLFMGSSSGYIYSWDGNSISVELNDDGYVVHSMAVYNNKLYAAIGQQSSTRPETYIVDIQVYDAGTDTWSSLSHPIDQRFFISMEVYDGKLYFGGSNDYQVW